MIQAKSFPDKLKLADITLIFKKSEPSLTKNYRPVSELPCVLKIFEMIIQNKLLAYTDTFLSPFICGYRKGFSSQIALFLCLAETQKSPLDKKCFAGGILMGLSKIFDTINHEF